MVWLVLPMVMVGALVTLEAKVMLVLPAVRNSGSY